jgi:carbonic anhydrase
MVGSVAAASCTAHEAVHWSYTGESGPEHWGSLSPEFAGCASGQRQSPIDIVPAGEADRPPMVVQYGGRSTQIVNNGHAIQLDVEAGQTLAIDGRRWTLAQVHFHTPAEHRVRGEWFPLEAHFVHRDADGHLAVVGQLYRPGAADAVLAQIVPSLPGGAGESRALAIRLSGLGPSAPALAYYRYDGSLTTPPCAEGVAWHVMQDIRQASPAQIAAFVNLTHENARPLQHLNGREVRH